MDSPTNLTSPILALTPLQIVSVIIFALTSLIGLLVYTLVLAVLIVYFREFKSNFYIIVISLSAADISYLALILFYVVPCTILQGHIWAPYDYGAGLLECLAYISQCVHLIFIAINRLAYASVSAVNPHKLDALFNRGYMVAFWIAFLWALSAAIAFPIKLIGCDLIYHYEALNFVPDCRDRISTSATKSATIADAVISGLLPVSITVLHVLTWCTVYAKGNRTTGTGESEQLLRRRNREKRILIQFTLISSVLLMFYASFWIFPTLLPGSTGSVVVTLFGIASSAVNPFTYLAFNKLVKSKAKHLVCKVLLRRKGNQVSSLHGVSFTAKPARRDSCRRNSRMIIAPSNLH